MELLQESDAKWYFHTYAINILNSSSVSSCKTLSLYSLQRSWSWWEMHMADSTDKRFHTCKTSFCKYLVKDGPLIDSSACLHLRFQKIFLMRGLVSLQKTCWAQNCMSSIVNFPLFWDKLTDVLTHANSGLKGFYKRVLDTKVIWHSFSFHKVHYTALVFNHFCSFAFFWKDSSVEKNLGAQISL